MAENNPIVSSGAFDFGDYVSGGNVFTTEGTTGDTDARGSISGTYVQNILRASDPIDEVPEGGGQPIKVTPPPEVSQALYEIDFNRKLFGANLDVVNTLQDIEFRQGFSGINTPVLNIAYLTLWKRGNAPTAGEKVSTEVVDANNTEFRIDKSTGAFENLENSVFGQGAILDPQNSIYTGQGVQGTFESSPIYRFPEWTVRAPDAVENKTTSAIQTPSSQFLPPGAGADRGITLGSFESTIRLEDVLPPEFSLSDGFFQPLSILNDLFQINSKPEIKPNRLLALSKAKIRLEEEKAKESPSTEMVRYYEDTIKQLEATTDEQFVADNDLPPDPRLEKAQPLPPLDGEVRKADVSWTTPPGSLLNKTGTPTEKVEGIWQFLFNPQTLERSFGPEYQFASTWGVPDGQPAHYSGHKNQELRFRDIILNGFVFGKRVESLVKGLEELTHVEKDSGQQSPPVLEFVWGKKVFGPCIMEDISITEQKWDGGELVDATLSFTLKKIPEWVVNDEYINIFNPVGQPLQKIIIEQPETTETTDTVNETATTATEENVTEEKGKDADNKECKDFKQFIVDNIIYYNNICKMYKEFVTLKNIKTNLSKKIPSGGRVVLDSRINTVKTNITNIKKLSDSVDKINSIYSKNKYLSNYKDKVRGYGASINAYLNLRNDPKNIDVLILQIEKLMTVTEKYIDFLKGIYNKTSCGSLSYTACRQFGPAGTLSPDKPQQLRNCKRLGTEKTRISNVNWVLDPNVNNSVSGKKVNEALNNMFSYLNEVRKIAGRTSETSIKIDNWFKFGALIGEAGQFWWLNSVELPHLPPIVGCKPVIINRNNTDLYYNPGGLDRCKRLATQIVEDVLKSICSS